MIDNAVCQLEMTLFSDVMVADTHLSCLPAIFVYTRHQSTATFSAFLEP